MTDKNRILIEEDLSSQPEKQERETSRKGILIPGTIFYVVSGSLLLLILLFVAAGYYWYSKTTRKEQPDKEFLQTLPEIHPSLKEKYYYPKEITPALEQGIQWYREGFLSKAEKHFHSIISNSTSNLEKAIAYTYLGIIQLDLEKFPMAKYYFEYALNFQKEYLPAIVNLAITEYKLGNIETAYKLAEKAKAIAPGDSLVALLTGNLLMNLQGAGDAEKAFRRGLELEPEEPVMRYNLAISLLRQGKTQEAVVEFQHFLSLYPAHPLTPNVLAYLGQIYYSVDQYERALEYFKRASRLAPDNAKFYYNTGIVYLKLKDNASALASFKKALNSGSTDPEVFEKLSYAFEEFQEQDLAILTLERSIQYNPDHLPTLFRLAELYAKKNDLLKAAEIYRKIVNRTPGTADTVLALLELGKLYIKMERYDDAVLVLKKAVELEPEPKIEVLYQLGVAYYYGGRKDKSLEIWKHALSKPYITPEEKEKLHIILAKSYQNLGSYDLALMELRKVDINPTNLYNVNKEYGLLYKNTGNYEEAISRFLKIFESVDTTPEQKKEAAIEIAGIYLLTKDARNLEYAKSWANKALRLDPRDPEVKILKARIHLAASTTADLEQAIEILLPLTYENLSPSLEKEVFLLLGQAYYHNKEYSRALQSFQKVLFFDPMDETAIRFKQKTLDMLEGRK